MGPVRERHARALAERYPGLDPARRAAEAERRALIEIASAWIDRKGVVSGSTGKVFDAAAKLVAWLAASERWIREVEEELRRPDSGRSLLEELARGRAAWERRGAIDGEVS